jgi:hypothetical protein
MRNLGFSEKTEFLGIPRSLLRGSSLHFGVSMGYLSFPEISLEIFTEANISYTLSIKYVVSLAA